MRKFWLVVVSAGLVAGVLVGCSSGGESTGDALRPSGAGKADLARKAGEPAAAKDTESLSAGGARRDSVKPVPAQDARTEREVSAEQLAPRKLTRTARMSLRVKNVARAAEEARDIASAAGGYTGSERSREKSARLTLTVPARELDAVLDDLEGLGTRVGRDVSVKDVTDSVVDVNSRVKSQRRSIERSRELFDQARTINEIIRVEQRLAAREAELESLLARQKKLADQVQMTPVTVTILREKAEIAKDDDEDRPAGFAAGLAGGWDAFVTVLAGGATAIGAAAPFLLAFGVPAVALIWLLRRRRPRPEPVEPGAA